MMATEITGVHYVDTQGPAYAVQLSYPGPSWWLLFTVSAMSCPFTPFCFFTSYSYDWNAFASLCPGELLVKCHLFYEILPFTWCLLFFPSVLCPHFVPTCMRAFLSLYWDYLSLPLVYGYFEDFSMSFHSQWWAQIRWLHFYSINLWG